MGESKMLLQAVVAGLLVSQCLGLHLSPDTDVAVGAEAELVGGIDDLLRQFLEDFRANMSSGFPQWGIPVLDPLHFNKAELAVDQSGFRIYFNVSEGDVTDLSTFVIDDVHVSVLTLKARLALSWPDIKLACSYYLDGLIAELFPLYGHGPSSISVGHVAASIDADLKHNRSDGHDHIQIENLDFNFHLDDMTIQIHNLFDSEDMATVIDGFAQDVGPLLIDVLVNDTRRDLLPAIVAELNTLLWNVTIPVLDAPEDTRALVPSLGSSANADAFFDQLIPNLAKFFPDPLPLPEWDATAAGTGIKCYNGHLNGLSTIFRGGESTLAYDESGEWLSINSEIHFHELKGGYSVKLEVFGIGPHVTADIKLSNTKAKFGAEINAKTLQIKLTQLKLSDIGGVSVTVRGLGIFEFLLDPIIDLIVDAFKGPIANAISSAMYSAVEGVLDKIDLLEILKNL